MLCVSAELHGDKKPSLTQRVNSAPLFIILSRWVFVTGVGQLDCTVRMAHKETQSTRGQTFHSKDHSNGHGHINCQAAHTSGGSPGRNSMGTPSRGGGGGVEIGTQVYFNILMFGGGGGCQGGMRTPVADFGLFVPGKA